MALQFFSNPFIFAVVLTAAIGVIVYEIINQRQRRVPAGGHGRRPPPSPPPTPPSHPRNMNRVKENASNVRVRNPGIRDIKNEETRASPDTKNFSSDNKTLSDKIRNSDYSTKNYEKNVLGKIKNDIENINKNTDDESKLFEKNISDESSFYSQNNLNVQSVESKLGAATVQRHLSSEVSGNVGNDLECNQNVSASPTNFVVNDYKKAVLDKIRNDAVNAEESFCKACDNKIADTVFYPCRHCNLCLKCAESVFRIYGKCSICHRKITSFERIATAN